MTNFKQINYLKTMLTSAKRSTKQEFEDSGILLNKETPWKDLNYWITRLENEIGLKRSGT
jgi:hypothetical protein